MSDDLFLKSEGLELELENKPEPEPEQVQGIEPVICVISLTTGDQRDVLIAKLLAVGSNRNSLKIELAMNFDIAMTTLNDFQRKLVKFYGVDVHRRSTSMRVLGLDPLGDVDYECTQFDIYDISTTSDDVTVVMSFNHGKDS